jgi:ComF family protein
LKYRNAPEIGLALGKMYGHDLMATHRKAFDLIIPVPLHISKKRKRGYNQSAEFGKGLAEILGIECSDEIMRRVAATETQTRKSRLHRWENVEDVFEVANIQLVQNRQILLVDDVVTTGATLEACGHKLISAGCKSLSIACIAATQ